MLATDYRDKRHSVSEDSELRGRIQPILHRRGGKLCVADKKHWTQNFAATKSGADMRAKVGGRFSGESPVDAEQAMTPGLRNEMVGSYMLEYENIEKELGSFAIKTTTSNKRTEIYGFPETAPYPARQDRGRSPKEESFAHRQFSVTNHAWSVRVPYHVDDVDDDQTGSLLEMARMAGQHFGSLDERIFTQITAGQTNNDLLPATLLAPDGVGIYSATDGNGDDRNGISGGNILAGTASPLPQDIRQYYQDTLALFKNFKDKKQQILLPPMMLKKGITIVYGTALEHQMKEAFWQKLVLRDSGTGPAAAQVSNVIMDSGDIVVLRQTPYISSTSKAVYVFLNGVPIKPIIKQTRRELYHVIANEQTSDFSRDRNMNYDQYRMRMGWGLSPTAAFATIRWTNS